jgi:HAD superfamily hydrolase (TIGR01509 family)
LRFAGVIFDVDGTLVDSNDAHARAFVAAFREFGHEVPYESVRRRIGKGSDKLIPELIGRYDEALAERKKAIFKARHLPTLRAFPCAQELVRALRAKGLKLAVASSAAKDELDALLEAARVKDCFDTETDADDAERSKPDPDIVQAALAKLALASTRCVMIGDTPYDAEAARRAGVAFAGLRCGGWSAADLQPATAVYADPAELFANIDPLLESRVIQYNV